MSRTLLLSLLGICLWIGFTKPVDSNDLGFHLRLGEEIRETRSVPAVDHHSYTADGAPFLDHSWLGELALYGVHHLGGMPALAVLAAGLAVLTFLLLAKAMGGEMEANLLILLALVPLAAGHFIVRPHLFGWILLAGLLALLRNPNRLWPIPLLLALWANVHGSFLLGTELAALHFVRARRPAWAAACLLAPLLNPYGPSVYLSYLQIRESVGFLGEWRPYAADDLRFWLWAGFLALLGGRLLRTRKADAWDWMLLIGLGTMGFTARRHTVVAAFCLAPMQARAWAGAFRPRPALLVVGMLAAALGLGRDRHPGKDGVDYLALPVEATDFLVRHHVEGPVFNDYNFGGWMLWKAWPAYKVFIDGRVDVYRNGPIADCLKASKTEPGWEQVLEHHGVRCVFIRKDRPLAKVLCTHPGWDLVYYDYHAVIFAAKGSSPGLRRLANATPFGPKNASKPDELVADLEYLLSQNDLAFDTHLNLAALQAAKGNRGSARLELTRYLALHPEGASLPPVVDLRRSLGNEPAPP